MVRAGTVTKAAEIRDATICLVQGTTNEQVTADYFRSINTPFKPVLYERTDQAQAALQAGRCDSFGTDASQLAGVRATMQNPKDWLILPERFSKEPYGAYVRRDDAQWFDVVRWYTMSVIEAEEQGVTQANVDEMKKTSLNPNTRRLLGVTPELGEALKLDRNWVVNIVKAVGNYGEIYDRNFGPKTIVDLPRGPNKLWTDGGLIYALPMR
jgi:general L-amino acid transport system substrate-binding protein